MKKYVFLVALLLLFNVLTVAAAGTEYSEGDFHYIIEDGAITVTEYFGNSETVHVPGQIAGIPVSRLATGAFQGTPVKELYLPDTITEVCAGAIPETVTVHYNFGNAGTQTVTPVETEPVRTEPVQTEPTSPESTQPKQENENDPYMPSYVVLEPTDPEVVDLNVENTETITNLSTAFFLILLIAVASSAAILIMRYQRKKEQSGGHKHKHKHKHKHSHEHSHSHENEHGGSKDDAV